MGTVRRTANTIFTDELEESIAMTLQSLLMTGIGKIIRCEGNKWKDKL